MKTDLIGRSIKEGDTVLIISVNNSGSFNRTSKYKIGKVVGFTEEMVVIKQKEITNNFGNNISEEGYDEKTTRKFGRNLVVLSSPTDT